MTKRELKTNQAERLNRWLEKAAEVRKILEAQKKS